MRVKGLIGATLFAALAPVLLAQQAGDQGARAISLDEAVKLAQQNAPQAIQARNTLRTSSASVRSALSAYIPSLTANASGSRSSGETYFQGALVPLRGDPWSYSRGFSSNLELFDGMRRWNNYRAAQASVDAADVGEVAQRFNVALNVKQQYFAVLAARESEAAGRRQLEQAEQQLTVSSAKVTAGAATRSDSLRAAILVTNARLAILTAQNNLRVANAGLTRLVASSTVVTALVADTSEMGRIELDSSSLARLAVEGPAVRQATASLMSSHAAAKASKSTYMPSITAGFTYNGNNSSNEFTFASGRAADQTNFRLSLTYPIFNGYAREAGVVSALATEENAEATLRDARFAQQQSLVQFLGAFRLAEQRVALQLATIAAAEEDLRVQQQRYNLGASTLLDVLTSQSTLDTARAALIQARFDARTAKAQIEALVGRDLK